MAKLRSGSGNAKNMSYAGKEGCCIYCPDRKKGCWCDECKCHSCIWYQKTTEDNTKFGRCSFQDYMGFEMLNVDRILKITYSAYVVSEQDVTHILPKAHTTLIHRAVNGKAKFMVPVWLKEQFFIEQAKPIQGG